MLTRFWHHRICEATIAVSLVIIGIYFLPYFMTISLKSLLIPDWAAILAGVTLGISVISYLWAPRKAVFPMALAMYLLLLATSGTLVFTTGETHSPFIALWIMVTAFASVFGLWAIVPILVALGGYLVYLSVVVDRLEAFDGLVLILAGLAPLMISYIIFHITKRAPNKESSAYHELATELTQVNNKSEVVIRAIDDGVIALDSHGNIELMNPSAQRILGWGTSDAIGLDHRSVLKLSDEHSQPVTDTNDPVGQVLATNKDIHTKQFYATTGGGKRILLSLVVSPIGQIGEGVIIVFQDITREHAEEREQAEFISTASHEMRTPVASIEGYLGLALNPQTAQIDAKARDFIEKAHSSAQHLGRLFQDLLDVSKADDGRLANHPKVVDMVNYVGEIVEGLRPKAEEKGLRLYFKPKPDNEDPNDESFVDRQLSPIYFSNVDNDHLREVVANLVENAIKYTQKGDVIVDIAGGDDHVRVSIQDSGIGIAHEDIPHLFQKFYRVDNSATREIGGTGLGLYLCRRLTEIMGGRIWLESELGKGSTFFLELPRMSREEATRMIDAESASLETEQVQGALPDKPTVITEQSAPQATPPQPTPTPQPQVTPLPTPQATVLQSQPIQMATATVRTSQPSSQPIVQSVTAPPIPTQGTSPATTTPLSQPTLATIEQNPVAYANARASGLQIPVRDLSSPNKSEVV